MIIKYILITVLINVTIAYLFYMYNIKPMIFKTIELKASTAIEESKTNAMNDIKNKSDDLYQKYVSNFEEFLANIF